MPSVSGSGSTGYLGLVSSWRLASLGGWGGVVQGCPGWLSVFYASGISSHIELLAERNYIVSIPGFGRREPYS